MSNREQPRGAPAAARHRDAGTRRRSLTDEAYDAIKRDIIRCELEPSLPVTEEQLAERYGVGRAAVRAALKRLYQQGLVVLVTPKRYTIAPITIKQAQDICSLRLLLEPTAARLAACRINDAVLAQLESLCDVVYEVGNRQSAERFLRANTDFHLAIARAAGNDVLVDFVATLLEQEERLNHLSYTLRDRNDEVHSEHAEILNALRRRDEAAAECLMRRHIAASSKFVVEAFLASPSVQQAPVTAPLPPTLS